MKEKLKNNNIKYFVCNESSIGDILKSDIAYKSFNKARTFSETATIIKVDFKTFEMEKIRDKKLVPASYSKKDLDLMKGFVQAFEQDLYDYGTDFEFEFSNDLVEKIVKLILIEGVR